MSDTGRNTTADRLIALRLWMHRQLDKLYDQLCDPEFTGNIRMELGAKDGRPGEPRVNVEKYGVHEL